MTNEIIPGKGFAQSAHIKWFYKDWENDKVLQSILLDNPGFEGVAMHGIWINMLNLMAGGFPYGHCSMLDMEKVKSSQHPVVQEIMGAYMGDIYGGHTSPPSKLSMKDIPNEQDILWAYLTLNLPVNEQLSLAKSIESTLCRRLFMDPKPFNDLFDKLEKYHVFSRSEEGILYSRRMTQDFKLRVDGYVNKIKALRNPKKLKVIRHRKPKTSPVPPEKNASDTPPYMPPIYAPLASPPTEDPSMGPLHGRAEIRGNNNCIIPTGIEDGKQNQTQPPPMGGADQPAPAHTHTHDGGGGEGKVIKGNSDAELSEFKQRLIAEAPTLYGPEFWNVVNRKAEELPAMLDEFHRHCRTQGKTNLDYTEYKKYFRNVFCKKAKLERQEATRGAAKTGSESMSLPKASKVAQQFDYLTKDKR